MKEEQIRVLGRYLGCECEYEPLQSHGIEDYVVTCILCPDYLVSLELDGLLPKFKLHLKPLSSLTQEDALAMRKEFWGFNSSPEYVDKFREDIVNQANNGALDYRKADWLRNNGYYLGEQSIKEFVKLKE